MEHVLRSNNRTKNTFLTTDRHIPLIQNKERKPRTKRLVPNDPRLEPEHTTTAKGKRSARGTHATQPSYKKHTWPTNNHARCPRYLDCNHQHQAPRSPVKDSTLCHARQPPRIACFWVLAVHLCGRAIILSIAINTIDIIRWGSHPGHNHTR